MVASEIWPDRGGLILVRKREIWGGEVFLEKKKEERKGGRGSGVSRFMKDIDHNRVSKRKGKKKDERKRKKKQTTLNFSQATLIKPIHCKKKSRWFLESAVISKKKKKNPT